MENPLFNKLGYKIFRNKFNSTYQAIIVYVTLSQKLFNFGEETDCGSLLDASEKNEIIQDSIKSVLNTIVFDPMYPAMERRHYKF